MGLGHSSGKYDKVRCLLLPAQSGKTRKVEEEIRELKRLSHIEDTESIDIFISANNRLLVHQTTARLRRSLTDIDSSSDCESLETDNESAITDDDEDVESDAAIKGDIFSWTHGRGTNIKADALADKILLRDVEMVLMCANKRRFRYLDEMLQKLTTHRVFRKNPANIYIWIDEADSSMNIWSQFKHILDMPAITRVTLVSATFGSVLDEYERLSVLPYETTHPGCYRRLADCSRVQVRAESRNPCKYVDHVLSEYARELCVPGKRAFIPGVKTKKSHYEIAELLDKKFGFAVILINGERKELRIPGEDTVDLREYLSCPDPEQLPAEFNQTLAELYIKHKLSRFPLAITGYLCIQRGVTFQCATDFPRHIGFVFDFGIIPPISDKAEAYQTMARMFGNSGDFPNYVRPTIYSNEKTFAGVHHEEEIAVRLPRIVHDERLDSVGPIEFRRAAGEYGYDASSLLTDVSASNRHSSRETDPRMTIPVIVTTLDKETYESMKVGGRGGPKRKVATLCAKLKDSHPELVKILGSHKVIKFACPSKEDSSGKISLSYKRHIINQVNAASDRRPTKSDIPKDHETLNCFNCFIDEKENRLCFVVWNGAMADSGAGRSPSPH